MGHVQKIFYVEALFWKPEMLTKSFKTFKVGQHEYKLISKNIFSRSYKIYNNGTIEIEIVNNNTGSIKRLFKKGESS